MKKGNMVLIIVIVVLIIVIAAGSVTFMMMLKKANQHNEPEVKIDENIMGYAFEQPFINNVNQSSRIVKITIELDINKKDVKDIEALLEYKKAEMQDKINFIISSKTEEELSGPTQKAELKKEILEALKEIMGKDRVVNVYFKEFIMQ